jgi:hypothetical protein
MGGIDAEPVGDPVQPGNQLAGPANKLAGWRTGGYGENGVSKRRNGENGGERRRQAGKTGRTAKTGREDKEGRQRGEDREGKTERGRQRGEDREGRQTGKTDREDKLGTTEKILKPRRPESAFPERVRNFVCGAWA